MSLLKQNTGATSNIENNDIDKQLSVRDISWLRFNLTPRILSFVKGYNLQTAYADFASALVVASTSLPLLMAYAIASDMRPEIGLYCAFASGLVAALLTGSRYQMTSPAAGFHMFVIGTMAAYGPNGLFTSLVLAGCILVLLGLGGLGFIVNYIPRPIILGMTNGIGAMLVASELTRLFGLTIPKMVSQKSVPEKLLAFVNYIHTTSFHTLLLGSACFLAMLFLKKRVKKIPLGVIVTVGGSIIAYILGLKVKTIGACYPGGIPSGFPTLFEGTFDISLVGNVIESSFSIAMLIAFKSMVSAVVGDRMGNENHNPNMELVSQGGANIASAFFGCMPATGSIGRTANNIGNGGKTPFAAVFQALIIFSILFFFAPVANHIPLCVLSGIMMYVVYSVGEWHLIPELLKLSKSEMAVWLITFLFAVFKNLETAMQVGVLLSGVLYIQKVSSSTSIKEYSGDYFIENNDDMVSYSEIPKEIAIFGISGPMMFGATGKLNELSNHAIEMPKVIILHLNNMTAIDSTAIDAFKDFTKSLELKGKCLILSGLNKQNKDMFVNAGFNRIIGQDNICDSLSLAVTRAKLILDGMLTG